MQITFVNDGKYQHESRSAITLSSSDEYVTINTNLSTRLEYKIPLNTEGGIDYDSK